VRREKDEDEDNHKGEEGEKGYMKQRFISYLSYLCAPLRLIFLLRCLAYSILNGNSLSVWTGKNRNLN
jgi:hypothetical protein